MTEGPIVDRLRASEDTLHVAWMHPIHVDPGQALKDVQRWRLTLPPTLQPQVAVTTGFALVQAYLPRVGRDWGKWADLMALGRQGASPDGSRLIDVFLIPSLRVGRGTAAIVNAAVEDSPEGPRIFHVSTNSAGGYRLMEVTGAPAVGRGFRLSFNEAVDPSADPFSRT